MVFHSSFLKPIPDFWSRRTGTIVPFTMVRFVGLDCSYANKWTLYIYKWIPSWCADALSESAAWNSAPWLPHVALRMRSSAVVKQRLLQCMMVQRNWRRKCGDIKQAYCWAELPKDQWMMATYPDGLQRTNEQGEELVMIVKKNLYGGPASGRNWGKLRDYSLLCVFNDANHRKSLEYIMKKDQVQLSDRSLEVINSGDTKGWQCKQCAVSFYLVYQEHAC